MLPLLQVILDNFGKYITKPSDRRHLSFHSSLSEKLDYLCCISDLIYYTYHMQQQICCAFIQIYIRPNLKCFSLWWKHSSSNNNHAAIYIRMYDDCEVKWLDIQASLGCVSLRMSVFWACVDGDVQQHGLMGKPACWAVAAAHRRRVGGGKKPQYCLRCKRPKGLCRQN